MSEKCENLYAFNEPLTTDHAIILPDIDDCSYSRYLEVINSVIGSKHIHSIFESNGQIKIYFKEKKYVTEILESGVLRNKDYSQASTEDFVLLKVHLSRVDPAIPDNCIEDALKTYGYLESPIVHTKVSEKSGFDDIDCGIREVKLKVYDGLRFPTKFNLIHEGTLYKVDAKVIEQTPVKRSSDVMKSKKKDKYGKTKFTNTSKTDPSLTCESFPEWCKNNPDNCESNKSQNPIDLLLQIHHSQSFLPKKSYKFYNKENKKTVLFEKKTKLPVIQEQQMIAFSKYCVANSSFDNAAKTAKIMLEKRHLRSNGVILQNRTFSQIKQICSDKTLVNLGCEKRKNLDSTKKTHVKFKKNPKNIPSSSGNNNQTKSVKTFSNIKRNIANKVHNTRGALKKRFCGKSNSYGKHIGPPNHSTKNSKKLIEKSDLGHNEINLALTSSPNFIGDNETLSEKLGVCDDNVCPSSKSSKHRSARKYISSEKTGICDKNICPSPDSSSLFNHKTVKRKVTLKKSCTYNDPMCVPSNSSLPEHRAVKKTSAKSSVSLASVNKSTPPNASLTIQKLEKGKNPKESDSLDNEVSSSNTFSSPKHRVFKERTSKKAVVNKDKCPSSKSSPPKLATIEVASSEESTICNYVAYKPSNSLSLPNSRAVKRKTSSDESGACNSSSPKSSSNNLAVQKKKKFKGKIIVCDSNDHLSLETISSPNDMPTHSAIQDLSPIDSNQNAVDIHHLANQSAIPIDNSLSEVAESDVSDTPIFGPILKVTETSTPDIDRQHPTAETIDDVSSNSTQLEGNSKTKDDNFNVLDKDMLTSETQISNVLSDKLVTFDLNGETALQHSITAEASLQVPIISSNNLNGNDFSEISNVSDENLEENVSSDKEDPTQNSIQDVINLNASRAEECNDPAKTLADGAMNISSCEEKKSLEDISIVSDHISPSLSLSLPLEAHFDKSSDFSFCNPEELDSSKSQSQNNVPITILQSHCEDYPRPHLNSDIILVKTACDKLISKSNCAEPTLESDLLNGDYVTKDENNKNGSLISNGKIENSCSKFTSLASRERNSLSNVPNNMLSKLKSNEINMHQYGKKQIVTKKYLKSKLRNSITMNPASFLIKRTAKNKTKNYGRYSANKMVHKLQHKNGLSYQTKKQREYHNRQYLFSSTQDKNIYEYEFDSDEDYSDQVSYSKWKNQNCSSKEYKNMDVNFTRRLNHSFNSFLQNKKRRNGINDVVMDENSEVGTFNNKIAPINELRKRFEEAISPASSKLTSINKKFNGNRYLPKNHVQTAGETSTKRKRVDSVPFCSDNDYFEVVHLGDGKHEKLSIIVKKKSKLDASNKRVSVDVNSDHQALKKISKDSLFEFRSDPPNSSSMDTVNQQNIKKCQRKITSIDLIQNSSPELHSEMYVSNHISYKTVPKYRVKSNTFSHGKVISSSKTSKEDDLTVNSEHQENNSSVPENSTFSKKGTIGKSQQLLQSNCNKLTNDHSSYKIVLQKISDNSNKKFSNQASSKNIKTKYRLKSNHIEPNSKAGKSKLVNKSNCHTNKNSSRNIDLCRKVLKTNEQTELSQISEENTVTNSVPATVLNQNETEVDFHSCVNGFLQQLASCSNQNEVPVQNSYKNPGKSLSKLCVGTETCSSLVEDVSPAKDLLKSNEEQNVITVEDKTSHLGVDSTSQYAEGDDTSSNVLTRDDSNYYRLYHLKECSIILERIPLPENVLNNVNASTFLVSESNTSKPLKTTFSVTSDAVNNELSRSSFNIVYIKKEPSDSSIFDREESVIEIEETVNPCVSSLSIPNCNHDLESSDNISDQEAILIQPKDNVVITNVISCNEIGEDFSYKFCDVKEEPHLEENVGKVSNNSSTANKDVLKQPEVLTSNQNLTANVNITEKCVEEYASFPNDNLSGSTTNYSVGQILEISSLSVAENDFTCSKISKSSHLENTNSSNVESSQNNTFLVGDKEIQNNVQNLHYVESSKSNLNNSEPNMVEKILSNAFQAVNPPACNTLAKSTGKLKKGNTKLTSIDKIAEFCALRKSAGQIPAHQLKISLLTKQDNPVANSESSNQTHSSSVPSISSEKIVDGCVNPDFNEKSTGNKKRSATDKLLSHKSTINDEVSVLSSEAGSYKDVKSLQIDSSIRKEQNEQATLILEKTRNESRKELAFTSRVGNPVISTNKEERSSNPADVGAHVDKLTPVQLNQSGCERSNSSGVLNRTDTYVVKSVAVKPQYIVNKNISNPEKRIPPKLYKKYPLTEKKLIDFINCMKYTKNVKHTTLQMLAKNNTPGAIKDLIVQLYEFFHACSDNNKKLHISRLIMLLNEK